MNQALEFKLLRPTQQHNITQKKKKKPNNYLLDMFFFVIRDCNILPICFQATSPNVDFAEDDVMVSQCHKKLSYVSSKVYNWRCQCLTRPASIT